MARVGTELVPCCALVQHTGIFSCMSTTHDFVQQVPEVALRHRLYIARDAAGLSQIELADRMGVSRRTIGNAETGAKIPRRPTLAAWSLATGVPLTWLEAGEVPPTGPGHDGGGVLTAPKPIFPGRHADGVTDVTLLRAA